MTPRLAARALQVHGRALQGAVYSMEKVAAGLEGARGGAIRSGLALIREGLEQVASEVRAMLRLERQRG